MKNAPLLPIVIICMFTVLLSQTVTVEPYGVSPREAGLDTLDIYEYRYTGLLNVGVETTMFLQGTSDAVLTAPVWTVLSAPAGSASVPGPSENPDEYTQVISFMPDLEGTYIIEFSDNGVMAEVTVNAAHYIGIDDGLCGMCHSDQHSEWEMTGHYSIFEEGMNGTLSDHYASYCLDCHTTGHDIYADNDGFDDWEFVFPDSADLVDNYGSEDGHLFPGVFDLLYDFYPDAMQLGRIQCESCHGPGSAHMGQTSDNRMVSNLESANCAYCHDDGHYHVYPEQWDISGHAAPTSYPTGPGRESCVRCHTGTGFIQYVDGVETDDPDFDPSYMPITCATCHEPHSAENMYQIRTLADVELNNGEMVTQGGSGKLCMNCHQGRRDADSYSDEPHSHYGPHYVPQADMLAATNAITFGLDLPTSPHLAGIENSCTSCHMGSPMTDDEGHSLLVGGHSFSVVTEEGVDNVAICTDCHGDVGDSFDEKMFYVDGNADLDGDGTPEGLQHEVHGLLDILGAMLPHSDDTTHYDPHDDVDETWSLTELKAAFNYDMVYYDHSYGIHNPAFTVALLNASITAMQNGALDGDIVSIDDIPNDQGGQVKVIWDAFVNDGIAPDPVEFYTIKRYDAYDDTWTLVGDHPADGSDRYSLVVPTLFDSTSVDNALTSFQVYSISQAGMIYESTVAEGYSVDNLAPTVPSGFLAVYGNQSVEISWDEPQDADFQYFTVYRNGELIGYSATSSFQDVGLSSGGEYMYSITATDVHENESENSPLESVMVGDAGDVNGDFNIDILDIVQIVSVILGHLEHTSYIDYAGDWNGDGAIDILDVVAVVAHILGNDVLRLNPVSEAQLQVGGGEMKITSDGEIAGFEISFQGDLVITSSNLPDGWLVDHSDTRLVGVNTNGSETEDILLYYTGLVQVETMLTADWSGNGVFAVVNSIPDEFALSAAYPNPFNPVTTVDFSLPEDSRLEIIVYDAMGREITSLFSGNMPAGYHSMNWDASGQASGVYIIRLITETVTESRKVMLLK